GERSPGEGSPPQPIAKPSKKQGRKSLIVSSRREGGEERFDRTPRANHRISHASSAISFACARARAPCKAVRARANRQRVDGNCPCHGALVTAMMYRQCASKPRRNIAMPIGIV